MLAACSAPQPAIDPPGAPPQSHTLATQHHRISAQSCPRGYAECITLKYGSPFEQQWCVHGPIRTMGFGPSCVPISYGSWQWSTQVRGYGAYRHHPSEKIGVLVDPNPGNPTDVTISETQKIKSSGGKIAYTVRLSSCTEFTGGFWCTDATFIGISTE
jgi:hypothetical protein